MDAVVFTRAADGLSVVAYPGDIKILLAMSLADDAVGKTDGKNLAGFAIWRTRFGMKEEILSNRIGFTIAVRTRRRSRIPAGSPCRPTASPSR